MRLTAAAWTGCIAAGLASFLNVVSATQVPFSVEAIQQRPDASWSAKPTSSHNSQWTLPRNSSNSAVVFDKYSLALAGGKQRLFVFAAEFHPWRLPVPSLWRDVLQKIRAAGFNTVSIYTHWGLIQPTPNADSIDLTGVNDLDFFLTVAKQTGLFVIARPGPYINAETTVGGMAPWTVNIDAVLRTNDTTWQEAWKPYIDAISRVLVKHQLVYDASESGHLTGGSVILVQADNEYDTGEAERAYMKELVATLKRNGVSVPITYNDPGRDNNFVDIVDLYGLDSYPQRFDCSHPTTWVPFRDDYLQYHMDTNPNQPFYIPEFQGGSYDPYGGPGYQACARMTNASFTRVANQALVAQRVTLLSLYMVYGGTNWGGLAEPDVYTSYDYGAALNEHRQTTDKYTELKRQGNFWATFPDLAMTEQIFDKPGFNVSQAYDLDANKTVDESIFRTTVLENPETKNKFYIVRYDNTTESRRIRFALEIESMGESILVGDRRDTDSEWIGNNYLDGRDSHIIPVDQKLPGGMLLRFSTVNVYRVTSFANYVVVSLDYMPGQLIEYSLAFQDADNYFTDMQTFTTTSGGGAHLRKMDDQEWAQVQRMHSDIKADPRQARASISISADKEEASRYMVYTTADGTWVILHLTPTSQTKRDFSALPKYKDPSGRLAVQQLSRKSDNLVNQFFGLSEDSVIVLGVDLLRNATYTTTTRPLDTILLWGSVSEDRDAWMMALPGLKHVYWNGEKVKSKAQGDNEWFYSLALPGPPKAALEWTPPKSSELDWRWKDSMPEAQSGFNDAAWVDANKTHSFNPYTRDPTLDTQGVILFASEYGFHANNLVWRGHFSSSAQSTPSDVCIKVEGGRSFAFSAWLNGVFLGSVEADRDKSAVGSTFPIPANLLQEEENVVTVLQDHMGIEMESGQLPIGFQDEDRALEAVKLPRGIVGFHFPSLRSAGEEEPEVTWKVQGNFHGEGAPDVVRRSLNEGGLHAEVQGWHLPGFDTSHWPAVSNESRGRVVFYRTSFNLDVPDNVDLGLTFNFAPLEGKRFRAQLYVNGWQMGKYVNHLGPQTAFPVQSGVVNLRGKNEVGVSVWSLEEEGWDWDPREALELKVNHVVSGEPRDGYRLDALGWDELRG